MLTADLINNSIPRLQLQDSVGKALQLIDEFRVTHLPVVADEKFLGMISEDDLRDAEEEKMPLELLKENFIQTSLNENEYFLNAVNYSNQYSANLVPVISIEKELLGVITIA